MNGRGARACDAAGSDTAEVRAAEQANRPTTSRLERCVFMSPVPYSGGGQGRKQAASAVSGVGYGAPMSGRVLLIDDDPSMLELLQNRLTRRGFTVTTLSDPNAALPLLLEQPFDVVLTD